MIDVLLVDDHVMLREGICAHMNRCADLRITGEAGSAKELFKILKGARFDVIILDIKLADASGIAILRRIQRAQPKARIIILTMYDNAQYASHALQNGAHGYVVKGAPVEELIGAVRQVHGGEVFVSPSLTLKISSWARRKRKQDAMDLLSQREFEVLTRLARGSTIKEVASHLGVSTKTVTTYRTRLMDKLKLANNAEIVRYALDALLID